MSTDRCHIVLTKATTLVETNDDLIGVDKGAYLLANGKKEMVLAIGDFDSINHDQLLEVKKYAKDVVTLNPVKDESDFEACLNYISGLDYEKMYVYGALGDRIDHEIANIRLCYRYPNRLLIQNEYNRIQAYAKGVYHIKKDEFTYCSLFCKENACVTLKGFAYPLTNQTITNRDLYTLSNEILEEEGILEVHYGVVLVVQSKDA